MEKDCDTGHIIALRQDFTAERTSVQEVKQALWEMVLETTGRAEEEQRRSTPKQKKPPIATGDKVEAKWGKQYFECIVQDIDTSSAKVLWLDGTSARLQRAALRRMNDK